MGKRVLIKGPRVQDVGYRLFLLNEAERLRISCFQADNVGKDAVVLFDGNETQTEEFIKFVKNEFPKHALIEDVEVSDYGDNITSVEAYSRRLMIEQLGKIVDVGLSMLNKQDEMINKQDGMINKQDEMIKKQDETLNEIRGLRKDLRSFVEERFAKLEHEIATIKEKIGLN
jgi:acylphosphatase